MSRAKYLVIALLFLVGGAGAQNTPRPKAFATRTGTPPRIDGRLNDPVWQTAQPIGPMTQVEPRVGEPPSEASEIRILFDADFLYLGMRFYDSEPSKIVSTTRERDAFLDADDRVEFVIDTFHDGRNAFFFQLNPGGSLGDALITNNGQSFNKPWDGIWEGRTTIDAEGWTAEVALPFKTLNFDPNARVWGINFTRLIGRLREEVRWASPRRDVRLFTIFEAGELHGLEGIRQGIGLDLIPFVVGNLARDNTAEDTDRLGDAGLDAFYKVTPSLTLSLTVNTDFAETEVDERQINLTRFPLFFPERRDFFLQDAGVFDFGLGSQLVPFFSRRIGRAANGAEVPILVGAKLTGRVGDYNLGVLDVATDDSADASGQNLVAARITRNIGEQSFVGALVTHGDPSGAEQTSTVGLDAGYRTTSFWGSKTFEARAWAAGTPSDETSGQEHAYGARIRYPNNVWSSFAEFSSLGSNFRPALGFVPRRGVKRYSAGTSWFPRINETIRRLEIGLDASVVTDTSNDVETASVELQPIGVFWESGEEFRVEVEYNHDSFDEVFEISDGVEVPPDAYDFTRYRVELETATNRRVSTELSIEVGDFYGGDRSGVQVSAGYRPNALMNLSSEFQYNQVSLPGGDFDTHLARLRARFDFTPQLSWNNFVQWDSQSDQIGIFSRARWIPKAGQDVFVVFNETLARADGSVSPNFQELAIKFGYTIRF